MNTKVEEALENGGKPKIGNGDRKQRRANIRLSKAAHQLCVHLCVKYMKEAAKRDLKFDSEPALVLFNEHEAHWHSWLNKNCDKTKLSIETKKMFQTYLLRYIDQMAKAHKQLEDLAKIEPVKPKRRKKDDK